MIIHTANTEDSEFSTQEDTAFVTHAAPRVRVIGSSHAMRRVQREALLAARLDSSVLISGERGVGKEVVARFIHEHSDRSLYGFATIDCEDLPDLLVHSALFGHVKGSFAGAYQDKSGLLESVTGGTVFLDEVGALSTRMQARLLWFLDAGKYQRVGNDRVQKRGDVRFIASTTADLRGRVAAGLFLEDLYRRLNVVAIPVPPLRERRDDISSLVDHFTRQFAVQSAAVQSDPPEISSTARDAFRFADWPGNVSELKTAVLRQLLRSAGGSRSRASRATKPELVNS